MRNIDPSTGKTLDSPIGIPCGTVRSVVKAGSAITAFGSTYGLSVAMW